MVAVNTPTRRSVRGAYIFSLTVAAASLGLLISLLVPHFRNSVASSRAAHTPLGWLTSTWPAQTSETPCGVQVFNQDPLILYIRDFLNDNEIKHFLQLADGRYEVSKLWPDEIGYVDTSVRVSESATIERTDIVRRVESRARRIMGWRNNSTKIQPIKVQRYGFNGYYTFHYDWDAGSDVGNRMTTFMVYLVDKCTGGGTNFPRINQPADTRWCDVIECDKDAEEGEDGGKYPGVTFKPIAGSAIFWENFYPNGTPHEGTRHAGLPVASGEKVGMNIWSWDSSWRPPAGVQ